MKFFISFVNQNFSNKPSDISDESWAFLRSVYSSVEDIDLFVGGLAEIPKHEAAVGPTFSCIIGIQFTLLMDGDRSRSNWTTYMKKIEFIPRYFYRHTSGPDIHPIDSHCLKEVKQRRLSDLICEHTDIKELAENVFHQVWDLEYLLATSFRTNKNFCLSRANIIRKLPVPVTANWTWNPLLHIFWMDCDKILA